MFPAVLSSVCPGIDPAIRGTSRTAVVVFGSVRKFVFASGHVEHRTEPAADLVDSGRSLDNQKLDVASGTFADTWWFEVLQTTHNLAARYKNNIYTNPVASLNLNLLFIYFWGRGGGAKGGGADLHLEEPRVRKEGSVLFNDALNTFYLRLYGVRHMVKDHSDCERGNSLSPYGLLFPINSKGSFICTIPQTG